MCEKEQIHFDFDFFLKANKNNKNLAAIDAIYFIGGYLTSGPFEFNFEYFLNRNNRDYQKSAKEAIFYFDSIVTNPTHIKELITKIKEVVKS